MLPEKIVKELYIYILKLECDVEDLAVFPGNSSTEPFVILLGDAWSGPRDARYMKVQDYIDLVRQSDPLLCSFSKVNDLTK